LDELQTSSKARMVVEFNRLALQKERDDRQARLKKEEDDMYSIKKRILVAEELGLCDQAESLKRKLSELLDF